MLIVSEEFSYYTLPFILYDRCAISTFNLQSLHELRLDLNTIKHDDIINVLKTFLRKKKAKSVYNASENKWESCAQNPHNTVTKKYMTVLVCLRYELQWSKIKPKGLLITWTGKNKAAHIDQSSRFACDREDCTLINILIIFIFLSRQYSLKIFKFIYAEDFRCYPSKRLSRIPEWKTFELV